MTNLELHNKLLETAKAIHELDIQHPELTQDTRHLQTILEGLGEAERARPIAPSLYRNSG